MHQGFPVETQLRDNQQFVVRLRLNVYDISDCVLILFTHILVPDCSHQMVLIPQRLALL